MAESVVSRVKNSSFLTNVLLTKFDVLINNMSSHSAF